MTIPRLRHGILSALLLAVALSGTAQDTTVVLLRHAERQSLFDEDSPLAEAGVARARALVTHLESFHPTVLYTSQLQRTRQTLAPLAAKLGAEPLVRRKDGSGDLAAEILREHRGQTVMVCWHHDLMKQLVRGLGLKGPIPYWSLDSYDRIWIVRIPEVGEVSFEERRQNLAPAPAGATQGP